MYKTISSLLIFLFLFAASMAVAQKPLIVADKEYDFTFITNIAIEDTQLDIHDYVSPYYAKDTLTGMRALEAALANEFGLKHIYWVDGHLHTGTSLSVHKQWITDGKAAPLIQFKGQETFLKKVQKSKGQSLLVQLVDENKGYAVWSAWISLRNIKADNDLHRMQKGMRQLIGMYPPAK